MPLPLGAIAQLMAPEQTDIPTFAYGPGGLSNEVMVPPGEAPLDPAALGAGEFLNVPDLMRGMRAPVGGEPAERELMRRIIDRDIRPPATPSPPPMVPEVYGPTGAGVTPQLVQPATNTPALLDILNNRLGDAWFGDGTVDTEAGGTARVNAFMEKAAAARSEAQKKKVGGAEAMNPMFVREALDALELELQNTIENQNASSWVADSAKSITGAIQRGRETDENIINAAKDIGGAVVSGVTGLYDYALTPRTELTERMEAAEAVDDNAPAPEATPEAETPSFGGDLGFWGWTPKNNLPGSPMVRELPTFMGPAPSTERVPGGVKPPPSMASFSGAEGMMPPSASEVKDPNWGWALLAAGLTIMAPNKGGLWGAISEGGLGGLNMYLGQKAGAAKSAHERAQQDFENRLNLAKYGQKEREMDMDYRAAMARTAGSGDDLNDLNRQIDALNGQLMAAETGMSMLQASVFDADGSPLPADKVNPKDKAMWQFYADQKERAIAGLKERGEYRAQHFGVGILPSGGASGNVSLGATPRAAG
jgi:hypothetical protein